MKSVCPTVCQKNENVLYNPRQPLLQTLDKTLQTSSKSLCPSRGLHSLHLNKSKRGEYNRGLALQAYLLYKINGSACRSLPIKHTIKGFPRNITKHTKRNMLRHSTNPCGKPSFSLPPWGGLWGWIQISSAFLFPLEGAGGWTQSKAFAPAKGYRFLPCMLVTLAFAQARANKCRCKIIKGGRGAYSLTLSTPGEPLK